MIGAAVLTALCTPVSAGSKSRGSASKARIKKWHDGAITAAVAAFKEAAAAHQAHDLAAAEAKYLSLLRFPGCPPQVFAQAAGNAGSILLGRGDARTAVSVLEAGVAVAPTAAGHYNVAVALHDLGLHGRALPHAQHAAKLRQGYPEAEHLIGLIQQELGARDEAQRHFEAASHHAEAGTSRSQPGTLSAATVLGLINRRIEAIAAEHPSSADALTPLSESPPIWKVGGLLTENDCAEIIALANGSGMASSWVTGDDGEDGIRNSSTAWLKPGQHAVVQRVGEKVAARVLGLPWGDLAAAVEPLQVVSYGIGQHFGTHHDSQNFHRRSATLLIYLSDLASYTGGATAFPHARPLQNSPDSADMADGDRNKGGLRYRGAKGTAILFLNHDPTTGRENPDAVHSGEAVAQGEKWIANFWLRG